MFSIISFLNDWISKSISSCLSFQLCHQLKCYAVNSHAHWLHTAAKDLAPQLSFHSLIWFIFMSTTVWVFVCNLFVRLLFKEPTFNLRHRKLENIMRSGCKEVLYSLSILVLTTYLLLLRYFFNWFVHKIWYCFNVYHP